MDDGEVEVISTTEQRPSRRMPDVRVKVEDVMEGLIKCPACNFAVHVSDHGCNLVTCRRPHPPEGKWFYFCFHCRSALGAGDMCTKCPWRNTKDDRKRVIDERNAVAQRNPIIIEEETDTTTGVDVQTPPTTTSDAPVAVDPLFKRRALFDTAIMTSRESFLRVYKQLVRLGEIKLFNEGDCTFKIQYPPWMSDSPEVLAQLSAHTSDFNAMILSDLHDNKFSDGTTIFGRGTADAKPAVDAKRRAIFDAAIMESRDAFLRVYKQLARHGEIRLTHMGGSKIEIKYPPWMTDSPEVLAQLAVHTSGFDALILAELHDDKFSDGTLIFKDKPMQAILCEQDGTAQHVEVTGDLNHITKTMGSVHLGRAGSWYLKLNEKGYFGMHANTSMANCAFVMNRQCPCGKDGMMRCYVCDGPWYCSYECMDAFREEHIPNCDVACVSIAMETGARKDTSCKCTIRADKTVCGKAYIIPKCIYVEHVTSPPWDHFKRSPAPLGLTAYTMIAGRKFINAQKTFESASWTSSCTCMDAAMVHRRVVPIPRMPIALQMSKFGKQINCLGQSSLTIKEREAVLVRAHLCDATFF